MPTLTVWRYPTPFGADQGELRVKMLRDRGAIVVHDAATVVWRDNAKRPQVRQLKHKRGSDPVVGGLWGALLGGVFLVPVAGLAVGAAAGALTGRLKDSGIDDRFIARLRESLTPGTSAIFLLTSDADLEQVQLVFGTMEAELIYTDLSDEDAARLRDALGVPEEHPRSPDPGDASREVES